MANTKKGSATTPGTTAAAAPAQRSRIAIRQVYNTLDAYADRMALRMAGPIMFVTGLLAWAFNWGVDPIPFSENGRGFGVLIFIFSIVIDFGVAAVGFIMGVRYRNRLVGPEQRRSWALTVAPLALAYALVTMVLVGIALQFVDTAFKDLALQPIYAVLLVGIACGVVAYYVANRTMQISVRAVLNVFIIILFAGIAFSAINVNDSLWWEESFSFLGTAGSTERRLQCYVDSRRHPADYFAAVFYGRLHRSLSTGVAEPNQAQACAHESHRIGRAPGDGGFDPVRGGWVVGYTA
ncbi:MAG: hypothetical protein IPK16_06970 [Anaerolineales bacterium]|nr:hypothetical protein [Anaerolineales bacterium]